MTATPQRLVDYSDVQEALADLCHGLCSHDMSCLRCASVDPHQVPPPFDRLLVHNEHMTTTLQAFYRTSVDVRVQDQQLDGNLYRRRIVLTLSGTDEVVEFGIVRIDLAFTPPKVREEILDEKTPLGDILIRSNVLRRIEPRWYLHVSRQCPLYVGLGSEPCEADVYGRVGTIYCDEQPAIELLELVTGRPPKLVQVEGSNEHKR